MGMTNARQELEQVLARTNNPTIRCASIILGNEWLDEVEQKIVTLRETYTQAELEEFFSSLDFKYDSGYGGQELFGTVWLDNGMWLSRGEYDGSEWWELHKYPDIPDNLKAI